MKKLVHSDGFRRLLWAGALICTILASFLPYAIEILLCFAAAFLVGAVLLEFARGRKHWDWFAVTACAVTCVSVILTLVLLAGHKLRLYVLIEALNLLTIGVLLIAELLGRPRKKAGPLVMLILCAIFLLFGAFSHLAYSRSVMATVAEWVIDAAMAPDEAVPAEFQALTEAGETSFPVQPAAFDHRLEVKDFEGMPVWYVNADAEESDHVIFYIHGGYYVHQMGSEQMAAMNRLSNDTGAAVVMPIYPLAPFHTTEENYETMVRLYEQVCRENAGKKIVLMGDSAGGGYVLALAEGLSAHGIGQPDELILLSPWVDVTMRNPDIAYFVDVDPMLTITKGVMSGEAWAGGLPTDDWHVSPIYGDLSALENVTIFVGTRELFYPDDTLLAEKLQDHPNVTLVIGEGQNHVYPVYPTIEGRLALEQIREIILR